MLPFCGYNMADYFGHWLGFAKRSQNLPKIFFVNWFRKDSEGRWLWPGYGENSRVLKWICERVEGTVPAQKTAIGNLPAAGALDTAGLDVTADDLRALTSVDPQGWQEEARDIENYYRKFDGQLPEALRAQLAGLKQRLR